jgi:hypothetical protein
MTATQSLQVAVNIGSSIYSCGCGWTQYVGFAGVPTHKLLAKQHDATCPFRFPVKVVRIERPFWMRAARKEG